MLFKKINDFVVWFFKPFLELDKIWEPKKLVDVIENIIEILWDFGIEFEEPSILEEKEWTDFRFIIKDPKQMTRIDTWLQKDIKRDIKGYYDIQISSPNPVAGKEDELRIRIYGLVR